LKPFGKSHNFVRDSPNCRYHKVGKKKQKPKKTPIDGKFINVGNFMNM
jgi:hypothetical protein